VADADYVINIAANMPDGAATTEQLDAVIEKLTGASKRSDEFRAAVARVTTELEAAKAVSAQAAAALAAGQTRRPRAHAREREQDRQPRRVAGARHERAV
jgi:hypothetical protein